jgi:hypothetical protein
MPFKCKTKQNKAFEAPNAAECATNPAFLSNLLRSPQGKALKSFVWLTKWALTTPFRPTKLKGGRVGNNPHATCYPYEGVYPYLDRYILLSMPLPYPPAFFVLLLPYRKANQMKKKKLWRFLSLFVKSPCFFGPIVNGFLSVRCALCPYAFA